MIETQGQSLYIDETPWPPLPLLHKSAAAGGSPRDCPRLSPQQVRALRIAVLDSELPGSLANVVVWLYCIHHIPTTVLDGLISPTANQQPHHRRLVAAGRKMQRGPAVTGLQVGISPGIGERLGDLEVTLEPDGYRKIL